MHFWEQFAISILKGLLAGLHVDTTRKSTLKTALLSIANDIYALYDLTPPPPPVN